MEVQNVSLNSANVRYNNANDETKVYDISANVSIQNGTAISFDGGVVKKDDVQLASFNMWGDTLNPSFQGLEISESCNVLTIIGEFIESVKAHVSTNSINI